MWLNISLAVCASVGGLHAGGQSVNLRRLGGLALAVGILVDEATVTVENIHAHLARGRSPAGAALDGLIELARERQAAKSLPDYSGWVAECTARKGSLQRKTHCENVPIKPRPRYGAMKPASGQHTTAVSPLAPPPTAPFIAPLTGGITGQPLSKTDTLRLPSRTP